MIILGITGGIGCGKSQVLELFCNKNGVVLCAADAIGRELQKKNGPAYEKIVQEFGDTFVKENGELDRKALAGFVFENADALQRLDDIVHPLVEKEVLTRMQAAHMSRADLFLLESAILLDVGYQSFCDEVWWLKSSPETRLRRLADQRGMSAEEALRIMDKQRKDEEFEAACDQIIVNDSSLEELRRKINGHLKRLGLSKLEV